MATTGARCSFHLLWHKAPMFHEQYLHWFHQGKNGPVTSQDLFKTREEKVFFTDNHRIHQYGKGLGRCSR